MTITKYTVLSFQNIVCVAMWSLLMYSYCFTWNILNEQMAINLYAMLLIKVRTFVFNTVYYSIITLKYTWYNNICSA